MIENTNHPSLGLTARWTAAARAAESGRADRLFLDPWAAELAGAEGAAWLARQGGGGGGLMALRTRYFDIFLEQAAASGLRQVVLLAAGLDTRAFRLDWPAGTHLFELDQAAVLEYKAGVLAAAGAAPRCRRQAVAADLNGPWAAALQAGGFDPLQPAAWLLEGILFYLPDEAILAVLAEVTRLSAPGSRLGFDVINHLTLTSPYTKAWVEMQAQAGAPWVGALDDPEAALASLGWETSLTQPGAADASFGRPAGPPIPLRAPGLPHQWYVTGQR